MTSSYFTSSFFIVVDYILFEKMMLGSKRIPRRSECLKEKFVIFVAYIAFV